MIDLRSDTVTRPSEEMKAFMMRAPLGDDVFREDPSVNELESYAANLLGFGASLFCPSGTMANQLALFCELGPMQEVILEESSHIYQYEVGGIAAHSRASANLLKGSRGKVSVDLLKEAISPADVHRAQARLVCLENTTNKGGGDFYTFDEIEEIKGFCLDSKLGLHIDGARFFNAVCESGGDIKRVGELADTLSICLSKGLGAPVGSLLLGSRSFIEKARKARKLFGGGMRQVGILASAGLYALENNLSLLELDHKRAKEIEEALSHSSLIDSVIPVKTNIIIAKLKQENEVESFLLNLKKENIHALGFGPGQVRFVTHLDFNDDDCNKVIETIKRM